MPYILLVIVLPVLGYAEIHYRLPFVPSFLFKKEPEIIFDLPTRGMVNQPVPLFLFLRDAQRFPVHLISMEAHIVCAGNGESKSYKTVIERPIRQEIFSHTFRLEPHFFPEESNYSISASLYYRTAAGKTKKLVQDNYRGIPHPPFFIYMAAHPLPRSEGWFWGDLHLHSSYTYDQVEFAAPIPETARAARAMGLDFMAVTDHSYDLDDDADNFLKADPHLGKWTKFREKVKTIREAMTDFLIIPGEEVSVGNNRGQNVHCLIMNDPRFHPGKGDSAERLFRNHPTLTLPELFRRKSPHALAIAAHPPEKPPLSHQLVLKRGTWDQTDVGHPALDALQILNGKIDNALREGIDQWKKLLLNGHHIGIVAGTDAHGNFNCYRQLTIPFFRMSYKRHQLLGTARTAVRSNRLELNEILESIRHHRAVISNGPFAMLQLKGQKTAEIGDTVKVEDWNRIRITAQSTTEFGMWKDIRLYYGGMKTKTEVLQVLRIPENKFRISLDMKPLEAQSRYIRLEASTETEQQSYFCMTNPIWIEKE